MDITNTLILSLGRTLGKIIPLFACPQNTYIPVLPHKNAFKPFYSKYFKLKRMQLKTNPTVSKREIKPPFAFLVLKI